MSVPVVASAEILLPLFVGALLGLLARRVLGRRVGGAALLVAIQLGVPLAVVGTAQLWPSFSLWEAAFLGAMLAAGFLATAHAAFTRGMALAVSIGSLLGGLAILEVGVRVFLPIRPGFSVVPQFLWGNMKPPFAAGDSACHLAYGEKFPVADEHDLLAPARPGAARRVVHIGDSMTRGITLQVDETFEAKLSKLEPEVEHINSGISGTAPDDYLLMLHYWLKTGSLEGAVFYLFAGNDLLEMDVGHRCSEFASVLVYPPSGPQLRFPTEPSVKWNLGRAGAPPYFIQALMPVSATAVMLAAVSNIDRGNMVPETERLAHLQAIFRSAHDELRARKIPFVVVLLPHARERTESDRVTRLLAETAQKAGVETIDFTPIFDAAGARRELLGPDGIHFSSEGNDLLAATLHAKLPAAFARDLIQPAQATSGQLPSDRRP